MIKKKKRETPIAKSNQQGTNSVIYIYIDIYIYIYLYENCNTFFYSFVYFFLTAEALVYFIVVSTPNLIFFFFCLYDKSIDSHMSLKFHQLAPDPQRPTQNGVKQPSLNDQCKTNGN